MQLASPLTARRAPFALACSRRPTAQAMYRPSGLNRAAATGFLKLKWCSSVRRSRLISRLRPSSSIDSSSCPLGLMHTVRTYFHSPDLW